MPDAPDGGTVFADLMTPMLRLAWLHTGNRASAEDAVAEAVANVWPRHARGDVEDVRPYLTRAVVNQVRSAGRRRVVALRAGIRMSADHRGHREAHDRTTDRLSLLEALQHLPDRQRLCVVLRYYEELSVRETAAAMDVSEGTVKSTTSRGLSALRDLLGEESR